VEQTSQLGSELGPGDDVDDHVVGVDERVEAVQHGERVLDDHVPLSYTTSLASHARPVLLLKSAAETLLPVPEPGRVDVVPLSYVVAQLESVARSADAFSERHEVEQVVDELPVGQREGDVEHRRGDQHHGRCGGRVRRTGRLLLLMLMVVMVK